MIITDMTLQCVHTPLRTPFVTALRRVEAVEEIVVTLHTDRGIYGLGAASATRAVTGEDLGTIEACLLHTIRPLLINQPFDLSALLEALHGCCDKNGSARAAADMALHDLAAKEADMPLYAYLGGKHSPFKTAVTISLNRPSVMAADAENAIARGLDILKLKVGGGDGMDFERIAAVRSVVPDAELLIDANQGWAVKEALGIIESVKKLGIALIEQPVPASDIKGLKALTLRSPIPILADESVFTLEDAEEVIAAKAADMVNIKLMKCGGIAKAVEIINYCSEQGIPCMMGSMLEGAVSIAAAAHLVMAYRGSFAYADLDSPLLYRSLPEGNPLKFSANTLEIVS
jgi:L-alanine-DL-glutamate epimerase-like enolase superfamily enzyme